MADTLIASITYSFKGQVYQLDARLDLARDLSYFTDPQRSLHALIAQRNQIDRNSYDYEVLSMEEIVFSHPTGRAVDFVHAGLFDAEGYQKRVLHQPIPDILQAIATDYLAAETLAREPAWLDALQAAYDAGLQAGKARCTHD